MRTGWIAAALLLAACGGDAVDEDAAPAAPDAANSVRVDSTGFTVRPAPALSPADSAIAAATADEAERLRAAADSGYTPWRAVEMPSEPWTQRAANPQALLTRVRDVVAAQLEEPDAAVLPTRMLAEAADSAVGLLIHPDLADDSVRDAEIRLHLRRDGADWTVAAVERRERCRRGVSPSGLCA